MVANRDSKDSSGERMTSMEEAIAAGDGTLHGAIDYWQDKHAKLKAALLQFCNEYEEYMKDTDGVSWRVVVADEVRNILAENS